MSPILSRLPKKEFESRAFKVVRTPYFSLRVKKNDLQRRRVGVIAGKAVHKSAVKRNFWRRQAKTALAELVTPGNDFLIIFFSKTNKLTKQEFRETLGEAVAKLHQ
jgi:ribonuclease P protein component